MPAVSVALLCVVLGVPVSGLACNSQLGRFAHPHQIHLPSGHGFAQSATHTRTLNSKLENIHKLGPDDLKSLLAYLNAHEGTILKELSAEGEVWDRVHAELLKARRIVTGKLIKKISPQEAALWEVNSRSAPDGKIFSLRLRTPDGPQLVTGRYLGMTSDGRKMILQDADGRRFQFLLKNIDPFQVHQNRSHPGLHHLSLNQPVKIPLRGGDSVVGRVVGFDSEGNLVLQRSPAPPFVVKPSRVDLRRMPRTRPLSLHPQMVSTPKLGLGAQQKVTRATMKKWKLTPDTVVYRSVDPQFVQKDSRGNLYILPNARSSASVSDPYVREGWPDRARDAVDLELPGVNVSLKPAAYGGKDAVVVRMRLGDLLKHGGRLYPDTSALVLMSRPFYITMPAKTRVYVEKE